MWYIYGISMVYLWYVWYMVCGICMLYVWWIYIYIWYMVYVYGNQSKKSKHRGNMTIPTVSNGI